MDITSKQARHVLAIDRFRHFGRAADYLGISQPALSRSLGALEKQLGLRLFRRDRGGVEPTTAGRRVLDFAAAVEKATSELAGDLAGFRHDGAEELRVACGAFSSELSALEAAGTLQHESRDAHVHLELTDWFDALTLLRTGSCDLAFCELNPDFLAEDLDTRAVGSHVVRFFVRRGHPLAALPHPTLEDLVAFPWATSRVPMRALTHIGDQPVAAGRVDLARGMLIPRFVISSVLGALAVLDRVDAVAIAPLSLAQPFLDRGEIAMVAYEAPWARLNYGFAWRAATGLSGLAERFVDTVLSIEGTVSDRESKLAAALPG